MRTRLCEDRVGPPIVYVLFDVPYLDGESLRDRPLIERKEILAALLKKSRNKKLVYSEHRVGHSRELYAKAVKASWEGIVSKRVDSRFATACATATG